MSGHLPAAAMRAPSACLNPMAKGITRRSLIRLASATSLGFAFAPLGGWAQDRPPACTGGKPYDAMVLSCIDPRIVPMVSYYMDVTNKQRCKYSQFVNCRRRCRRDSAGIPELARDVVGKLGFVCPVARDHEGDRH